MIRSPFDAAPDAAFYYEDAARRELLGALQYALKHGDGIIKVTGEAGSGKSMLCAVLQARYAQPDQQTATQVVRLALPALDPRQAMHAIARQLGLAPDGMGSDEVLRMLDSHLNDMRKEGKLAVLLVEEAQALPLETLEELRLLTNLDVGPHKLLPMVLLGGSELNTMLRQARLRQLRERITLSFVMPPLPPDLVPELLDFRLRAAGHDGPSLIQLEAARLIARTAGNDLRRLVALADSALACAVSVGAETVSALHVKAAVKGGPPKVAEAPTAAPTQERAPMPVPMPEPITVQPSGQAQAPAQQAAPLPGLALAPPPFEIRQPNALSILPSQDLAPEPASPAEADADLGAGWEPEAYVEHAPPPQQTMPQVPRAASRGAVWAGCAALAAAGIGAAAYLLQPATAPLHTTSGRVVQMAAIAQAKPAAAAQAGTVGSTAAVQAAVPVTTIAAASAPVMPPSPATTAGVASGPAKSPAATSSAALKAAQARGLTLDVPGDGVAVAKAQRMPGLLKQSLAASKTWLRDEPADNYSIQIENIPAAERERAEHFLADTRASIGLSEVHTYPMLIKGEPRIAIVYGSFTSAKKALEVQAAYEERLGYRPKIRTIKGIRAAAYQAEKKSP